MKKNYLFLASLILGLMVASCQNGLEEVLEPSAVQDGLATTRSGYITQEQNESINSTDALYLSNTEVSGAYIVRGSTSYTFFTSNPSGTTTDWEYDTSIFSGYSPTNTSISLSLIDPTVTADTYIKAVFKNADGTTHSMTSPHYVGINGPHWRHCSLRVLRSSDGVEVYPSTVGLDPNTGYYAYFTTSTGGTNMMLDWDFTNITNDTSYDHTYSCYFQTDSNGYCFLDIYGKMPGSSISKWLLGVTLY